MKRPNRQQIEASQQIVTPNERCYIEIPSIRSFSDVDNDAEIQVTVIETKDGTLRCR